MENGILPSHSKMIYDSIIQYGYNINQFVGTGEGLYLTIRHKPSGHHFVVSRSKEHLEHYNGYYSTFTLKKTTKSFPKERNSIGAVLVELKAWLNDSVKRANAELAIENPWNKYKEAFQNTMSEERSSPLNETESKQLKEKLNQLPDQLVKILKINAAEQAEFKKKVTADIESMQKKIDAKESKGVIKTFLIGYGAEWALDHAIENVPEFLFWLFQFLSIINLPPHI